MITLRATMTDPSDGFTAVQAERRDRMAGYSAATCHYLVSPKGAIDPVRPRNVPSPFGELVIELVGGVDSRGEVVDTFTEDQAWAIRTFDDPHIAVDPPNHPLKQALLALAAR